MVIEGILIVPVMLSPAETTSVSYINGYSEFGLVKLNTRVTGYGVYEKNRRAIAATALVIRSTPRKALAWPKTAAGVFTREHSDAVNGTVT
jgi:hypothetical protein